MWNVAYPNLPEAPSISFNRSISSNPTLHSPRNGRTNRCRSRGRRRSHRWDGRATTDSLCPKCVKEARKRIIEDGEDPWKVVEEKPGEIKATIVERNGEIWMIKECPVHGTCEDMMAMDSKFLEHVEAMFPGRDIDAHNDEKVHHHASSTVKFGRGSVLTIDLTNRCNMMCDPCFMDANQVGFVHELELGRCQGSPRQRDRSQTAPPDVSSVFRR